MAGVTEQVQKIGKCLGKGCGKTNMTLFDGCFFRCTSLKAKTEYKKKAFRNAHQFCEDCANGRNKDWPEVCPAVDYHQDKGKHPQKKKHDGVLAEEYEPEGDPPSPTGTRAPHMLLEGRKYPDHPYAEHDHT